MVDSPEVLLLPYKVFLGLVW